MSRWRVPWKQFHLCRNAIFFFFSNNMKATPAKNTEDARPFSHVEILDFTKEPVLVKETVDYYCTLSPERAQWTDDQRSRVTIRTECKWGRVPVGGQVFMLSEFGDGPRAPLSKDKVAIVQFYAEVQPSTPGAGDGYIEQAPFCRVQFDDESCRKLRAKGLVRLEEFIRRSVPEYAKIFAEWQSIIHQARVRYEELKKAKASKVKIQRVPL